MPIKKVVKIKLKFEDENSNEKVFHLKVSNFDKKKQKKLKNYGKELEIEFKKLNADGKKVASAKRDFVDATEDFEDAERLATAKPEDEAYALALSQARKTLRKARKKYEKLKVEELKDDTGAVDELNEKIFRKQLELIVVDSKELIAYIEEESHPSAVVVAEIFRLMKEAQKNN